MSRTVSGPRVALWAVQVCLFGFAARACSTVVARFQNLDIKGQAPPREAVSSRRSRPLLEVLLTTVLPGALLLGASMSALAHGGHPVVEGDGHWSAFVTGFLHPLTGPDHVIAMVAVGLWGAVLGAPALWLLPVVFPLVMALGGALALVGLPLPGVEVGIAASGVALGLAVALRWKAPLAVAAVMVCVFAVFHGHAHGTELPQAVSPLLYSLGFVIATGLLHLCGVAFGVLSRTPRGWAVVRAAGALIAATGAWFLQRAL